MTSGMTSARSSLPALPRSQGPRRAGGTGRLPGHDAVRLADPPVHGARLLKAILAEGGINASVAYANLWFAESVGLRRYSLCASNMPIVFLAGEWTFAGAAFPDDPRRAERDAEYLRQVRRASDGYPQVWSGARGGEFTRTCWRCARRRPSSWTRPPEGCSPAGARVIGCTSTFEQACGVAGATAPGA